jgi:hypothetical protein
LSITSKLENLYTSSTPPSELYLGRVWIEETVNGIEIWVWNGTYWLSQQTFRYQFSTAALGTAVASVVYPANPAYNIFLTDLIACIQVNVASTPTTNWGWNLARINSAGTATTLFAANSSGQAANAWATYKTAVNSHINLAATGTVGFRLLEVRTGTISKQGTISFEYRRARL